MQPAPTELAGKSLGLLSDRERLNMEQELKQAGSNLGAFHDLEGTNKYFCSPEQALVGLNTVFEQLTLFNDGRGTCSDLGKYRNALRIFDESNIVADHLIPLLHDKEWSADFELVRRIVMVFRLITTPMTKRGAIGEEAIQYIDEWNLGEDSTRMQLAMLQKLKEQLGNEPTIKVKFPIAPPMDRVWVSYGIYTSISARERANDQGEVSSSNNPTRPPGENPWGGSSGRRPWAACNGMEPIPLL